MMKRVFMIFFMILMLVPLVGQTWETPVGLGIYGTSYDIGRDNAGHVHIIWLNGPILHYGRIENGTVVGQELIPRGSTNVHTRFTRPRIGVRPDGLEIHTTWIALTNGRGSSLRHAWRNSSGAWTNQQVWSNGGGHYYIAYPSIGADSSGVVHIIAQQWNNSQGTIYGRKAGGHWTWRKIRSGGWRQQVSFTDRNGGFHATWRSMGMPGEYRYCPTGGNLYNSPTLYIPKVPGTMTPSLGDLFVADNGDVHNAFASFTQEQIDYYVKRAGSNIFGEVGHPSNGHYVHNCWEYDVWPAVVADNSGNVVVAYGEIPNCSVNGFQRLIVAYFNGSIWQRFTMDSNASINGYSKPAMTITDNAAYLVWRSNTGELKLATSSTATFAVTSPNGGEVWNKGDTRSITWNSGNHTGNLKIILLKDGVKLGNIVTNIPVSQGSYSWTVGNHVNGVATGGSGYKIKIRARDNGEIDVSDANFTIYNPYVAITSPNGGESWLKGNMKTITWTSFGVSGNIKLMLLKNGVKLGNIVTNVPVSQGSYFWTVGNHVNGTAVVGSDYKIKIRASNGGYIDQSNANFSIQSPSVTLNSPNGGELLDIGNTKTITWTSFGVSGNIKLILLKNGVKLGNIVTNIPASQGSYSWTVGNHVNGTAVAGSDYKIKIRASNGGYIDLSDANFALQHSTLTVIRPNGGEVERAGTLQTVTWNTTGTITNVKIESSPNNGQTWTTLIESTPNTGTYSGVLPTNTPPLTTYLLRISDAIDGYPMDVSDGTFTILPALPVSLISPNGGEVWTLGTVKTITWTSFGVSGNIKLILLKNGVKQGNIVTNIPVSQGSYSWTVGNHVNGTAVAGSDYKIKIRASNGGYIDLSDANFTIN